MKRTDDLIIVQEHFNTPIEKVWRYITELGEMKQWYFENIDNFKPKVGSKSSFKVQAEGRIFTHLWEVTEVEAPRLIKYNWKYKEYPGDSFVTFELEESDEITTLTLTVEVTVDFPDEIPEFKRESCIGGWNYFIKDRLRNYLCE